MFLTTKEVMERYKISRTTLYRWEGTNRFPEARKFGTIKRWALPELLDFEANC